MKLSVLPVSYFSSIISGVKSIRDWAEEGASIGLDAIDISVLFLKERNRSSLLKFRQDVEGAGMSICGASTYPDFTHPDSDERKRQIEQFRQDMSALSEVGTKIVRITAGQKHPGMRRKEGMSRALKGILASVDTAESLGLQLVVENHAKPGVWDFPDFNLPTDIFLEMADRLKETPVKIQFDTANPIVYSDDPFNVLEPVIERVVVVHASDTKEKGRLVPSVIGKGLVPFTAIFQRLQKSGYNGWISIEEASGTGPTGVGTAVTFIRECWDRASNS